MAVRLERVGRHLDPVRPVRTDNVVENLEVGPGRVDAMLLVALLIVSLEAVVGNHVPLDPDMMSIPQDSLVIVVMNEIALQNNVVGVVEFDPIPAVPDLEALDRDPTD